MRSRPGNARGQGLIEFALVLPLILLVALGLIEFGSLLVDQHVVTKMTREGSNLISRDTSLADAVTAMQSMHTRPIDFSTTSRMIFSVLRKGSTTGTANFDRVILYQRHEFGALSGMASALRTRGPGSFRGGPDYEANNADTDINLQIADVPAHLAIPRGGFLYVTEIFTQHPIITPLDRFGVTVPNVLYSIAYF